MVILVVRFIRIQPQVEALFTLPPDVKVVCIGSSHTGCTWTESSEFRNRVLWDSAQSLLPSYLRFLELERRGELDSSVSVCIIDCDLPAMWNMTRHRLGKQIYNNLPFAWRYLNLVPLSNGEVLAAVASRVARRFSIQDNPPAETIPWTQRTSEERTSVIGNPPKIYDVPCDDPDFPPGWKDYLLAIIRDLKTRCKKHHIRLILFASPLTSDHPMRHPGPWTDALADLIGKIRDLDIEYLDCRATCPDDWFRDCDHLLPSASRHFTERFWNEHLPEVVRE